MGSPKYSTEFRESAVHLVLEQKKSPAQVARELGVTPQSVREWVKKHDQSQKDEYLRIGELEREVKRLKKELAESQENENYNNGTAALLNHS